MPRRIDDPFRRAWQSLDFRACADMLSAGELPLPSTARRVLAPRAFWLAASSPAIEPRRSDSFALACAKLAQALPAAMAPRQDLLGDMLANGSPILLASSLARREGRFWAGELPDAELAAALRSLLALLPKLALLKSMSASWRGSRPDLDLRRGLPIWTLAAGLPPASAQLLLESAEAFGPLDGAMAWSALRKAAKSIHPLSARALASRASAADPQEVRIFCTDFALSGMDTISGGSASERLGALEAVCSAHAGLAGSLDCAALIGSRELLNSDAALSAFGGYALLRPSPFDRRSANEPAEALRARWLLDWLDGCARIAAKLGLPDIAAKLPNDRLRAAYASIGTLGGAHGFPTGAASIEDAFNARKLAWDLEGSLRAPGLPSRRQGL